MPTKHAPSFQKLSHLNPVRHMVFLLRSLYLKRVEVDVLLPNIARWWGFALLMLNASILRFQKLSDSLEITMVALGQNAQSEL